MTKRQSFITAVANTMAEEAIDVNTSTISKVLGRATFGEWATNIGLDDDHLTGGQLDKLYSDITREARRLNARKFLIRRSFQES